MGIKINLGSSVATTVAADTYADLQHGGAGSFLATEAQSQTKFYTSGRLTNLYIYMSTNSSGASSTCYARVNGASSSMSFTITASTTGHFEDTTSSVSIAANDLVDMFYDRGAGGTQTLQFYGAWFDPGATATYPIGATGTTSFTAASTTTSICCIGLLRSGLDSISGRIPSLQTCTLQKLNTYVSVNGRSTNTTFKMRKTAADAGPTITIGASTTGLFEDTSNTGSFVATDQISYHIVTGTGTGTLTLTRAGFEYVSSTNAYQTFFCEITGRSLSALTDVFIPIQGAHATNGFEVNVANKMRGTGSISNFNGYISANTATATTTYTLRVNGADTSVTFSVGAGATGQFSDTSNSATYTDGQTICYKYSKPTGSGSVTHRWFTSLITPNTDFTPRIMIF